MCVASRTRSWKNDERVGQHAARNLGDPCRVIGRYPMAQQALASIAADELGLGVFEDSPDEDVESLR